MNIRRADASELARIREIDRTESIETEYRCVLAPDGRSIGMVEERFDPPKVRPNWDGDGIRRRTAWWARELEKGGVCFVAESAGRVVGIAILGPEKSGKCAEILSMFVDKEYRSRGLGGRLIAQLEGEARSRGIESLCVHSNENSNALGFYQSAGYRIVCLMDPSITWLPGMETCIVLAKKL